MPVRCVVLVLCATVALTATAAAAAPLPLTARLAQALAVPGVPRAGVAVVDLATGNTLFERNADLPLEPASNEKLPVTFAALRELGPGYRFATQVVGRGKLRGRTWVGSLFLVGAGDPSLSTHDLSALAAHLRNTGIRRVTGGVLGDESRFDRLRTAPGWKASYLVNESPPLSALVVDRGRYDHHTAVSPALAAAGTFRQQLRLQGISVGGPAALGKATGGTLLARHLSYRLERIIAFMDRQSDNFTAELLLKELGAVAGGGGTTAAGVAVVGRDLLDAGIPLAGVRLVDGSGLSSDDRLTARAVVALLLAMYRDPAMRTVLWQALPVAGRSGTLAHRLESRPAYGAVRAKTGTTDNASSLSGFAGGRFAFAVLDNGAPVQPLSARKSQDRLATVLAAAARSD